MQLIGGIKSQDVEAGASNNLSRDLRVKPCNSAATLPKSPVLARPLRLEFAGAIYHLTNRGNDWQKAFFSDSDRMLFLNASPGWSVVTGGS